MGEPSTLSRRAMIGMGAAASAIVGVPAVACPGRVSLGLLDLIEARRRTQAAWLSYRDTTFEPMQEAQYERMKRFPHQRTTLTFINMANESATLSTEPWSLAMAKHTIEDAKYVQPDHLAAAQEAAMLAKAREEGIQRLNAELRVSEIEERESELMSDDIMACGEVLDFPAASVTDVMAKLRFIMDNEQWDAPGAEDGILADLDRLKITSGARHE